ncbi:MAG: type II toxin-antitoxin system VapC family toxin [Candidatus Promineifilaceae bacterium]|nr:type II toxin-antitoxin system VapC family toxin [Anaerolineaceae bacterium]
MYVLDTNTLIYFFKGMGHVPKNLLAHSPKEIGIPTVVLYELEVGLAKSAKPEKRRQQLAEMLAVMILLPFGEVEARHAAQIRATLEQAGQPIGPYDLLIAGTAWAHNHTLVTHNVKEFSRVAGLQLEDWY